VKDLKEKSMERNESISQKIATFVSRNKALLWGALILGLVVIVAAIAWDLVYSNKSNEANLLANEMEDNYIQWTNALESEKDSSTFLTLVDKALEEYKGSYAHQKALFIRGQYSMEQEDWTQGVSDFVALHDKFPKSYLASVALFNAAVAQEEQGKIKEAIDMLDKLSVEYENISALVPEALFNLGRLYEVQGDVEKAKSYYEQLVTNFSDTDWTNLAKSRIISLDIESSI
jgi:tetratricopeptide (TPR) repeat protein